LLLDESIGDEDLKLNALEDDELLLGLDEPPAATEQNESLSADIDLLFDSDNDLFGAGEDQSTLDENGKSSSEDDVHVLIDLADDEMIDDDDERLYFSKDAPEPDSDEVHVLDGLADDEVLVDDEGLLEPDEPLDLMEEEAGQSAEDQDVLSDFSADDILSVGADQPTLAEKEAGLPFDELEDLDDLTLEEDLPEEEEPLILDAAEDTEPSVEDDDILADFTDEEAPADEVYQPTLDEKEAEVASEDFEDLDRLMLDETSTDEEEPLLLDEPLDLTEPETEPSMPLDETELLTGLAEDDLSVQDVQDELPAVLTEEEAEPIGYTASEEAAAEATGPSVLTVSEEEIGSGPADEEDLDEVVLQLEPDATPDDSSVPEEGSWDDKELSDEELDAATADMFRLPEQPEPEPADSSASGQAEVGFDMSAERLAAASLVEDLMPPVPVTDDAAADEPPEPVEPPNGLEIKDDDITPGEHESSSFWEEDTMEAIKADITGTSDVDQVYEQVDEEQMTGPEKPLDEPGSDVAQAGDILLLTPEMMEPPSAYPEPEQEPEPIMAAISPEPALKPELESVPPMEQAIVFESAPQEKDVDKPTATIDQIKFEETLAAIIVDQISEDRIAGLVTQAVENVLSQQMTTELVTRAFEEALTRVAREVMVEVAERIIGSAVEQLKGDLTIEE
ncbi:MAG: hypothetical protein HQK57_10965, partial [Deltaproteobacteria bacterium]|nr:hypothetical protein [Deltaproteobacteria bacterium]